MNVSESSSLPGRELNVIAVITAIVLSVSVLVSALELLQPRLLSWGSMLWPNYAKLRQTLVSPKCDPNPNLAEALRQLEEEALTDDLGLFEIEFDREAAILSLEKSRSQCQQQHAVFQALVLQSSVAVQLYKSFELNISQAVAVITGYHRYFLLLILLLGVALATLYQQHIAFRKAQRPLEQMVSGVAQVIAYALLLTSAVAYWRVLVNYNSHGLLLVALMIVGLGVMIALSLWHLWQCWRCTERWFVPGERISVMKVFLCIPLFVHMVLLTALYFIAQDYLGGIMVLFFQLLTHVSLFLKIALYIWLGMLLKQTRLGETFFSLIKPWRLQACWLVVLVIALLAYPTAYTGASGIIVIALGGVVFRCLLQSGVRPQLALAATAMTGSTGVVLSPCLLIVLIAALNKEVVTTDLYTWGHWVFLVSLGVLWLLVRMTQGPVQQLSCDWCLALRSSKKQLQLLLPYLMIFVGVCGFSAWALNAYLDEFSAPVLLAITMLGIVYYDKYRVSRERVLISGQFQPNSPSIRQASNEACVHIGALLMLMGMSFVVGGVIERSGVIHWLPQSFAEPWMMMALLVCVLVVLGMVMDPFGAVVLVSSTLTTVAYDNGINPVHFWMVCLVAFELGYLTPPVALNHLIARQAIGEQIREIDQKWESASVKSGFWFRHEKLLLPLVVMSCVLMVTAFGPFIV